MTGGVVRVWRDRDIRQFKLRLYTETAVIFAAAASALPSCPAAPPGRAVNPGMAPRFRRPRDGRGASTRPVKLPPSK